jgi:hypothetical protein
MIAISTTELALVITGRRNIAAGIKVRWAEIDPMT